MEEKRKKRFLVLVDEDRVQYVDQVFAGYDWARVIPLLDDEFPCPPDKRMVSRHAWEVLRQGARIPLTEIEGQFQILGTRYISDDQRTYSERWCLAEIARRENEDVDYDE